MKSYKNLEKLNKKIKSRSFQFNEQGELVFYDEKTKEKIQVGQLRPLDEAPSKELEEAMKFYGIEKNNNKRERERTEREQK